MTGCVLLIFVGDPVPVLAERTERLGNRGDVQHEPKPQLRK